MSKIEKNLGEIFDMEIVEDAEMKPFPATPIATTVAPEKITEETIDGDYDQTRENLIDLIRQGQDALQYAISVAKQSEHPRAFEVVGNLVKQMADLNMQVMDLHQQKKKIEKIDKTNNPQTVNNSIFVGSTSELNKILNDLKKD